MTGSAIDTARKTVSGAVGMSRQVGGRAAKAAGPRIVKIVEAVRTRFTGPHAVAPAPGIPAETRRPETPERHGTGAPNPASVAKNIAKHDPANDPVIPKSKPVKRSVPGAKLPTRRS